ncbi:2-oxo acid dehydrogenase subunit E2 [Nonomuraea soli]|uniref:Dihydrolipoamide acetyltransferase component of pyruvate dehydrogenase complex n=1 Tax=Nonomuraea soli TaxID=1032476 RepID=A0A7W0HMN3_9ACTN|nr:2-oxo acid dehydrogenase subunit E2 [Nonomuraea soli]MBA2888954.1 2-oxoglutarate dehydrogenase E2 component (dihydrolipoamide succinyltransferase) [Nonomuraea soli]
MGELLVPRLNPNDTEYLLVEWVVENGAEVRAGEVVAVVESSKAATDLESPGDGVLVHEVKEGAWCEPGAVLGRVTLGGSAAPAPVAASGDGVLITEPARALMAELGVTEAEIAGLGVAVVKRSHVEEVAGRRSPAPASAAGGLPLTRVQRAVARAVSMSHQTIPAAYTVMRFDVGQALARAEELTQQVRRPVGLAELFVHAIAALHPRFPLFFATLDGDHALPSPTPHVGVTFDLGEGLYVPVVRDPASLTVKELAVTLMRYRVAASKGEFKGAELTGATITLTLHTEPDVIMAIPFVFPGQVAALALPAARQEGERMVADVGLAYDHRLINGRDAALFLSALKNEVS